MASKETSPSPTASKDELLDELASFLYDAYQDHKQKTSDKMETSKGRNADDESESTKQ